MKLFKFILMLLFCLIGLSSIAGQDARNMTTFQLNLFRFNLRDEFYLLPSNATIDIQRVNHTCSPKPFEVHFWNNEKGQIYYSLFFKNPAFLKTKIKLNCNIQISNQTHQNLEVTKSWNFDIEPLAFTIRHLFEFTIKNTTADELNEAGLNLINSLRNYYWTKPNKSANDKLKIVFLRPLHFGDFRIGIGSFYEPSDLIQSFVSKSSSQLLLHYLPLFFLDRNLKPIEINEFKDRTGGLVSDISDAELHNLVKDISFSKTYEKNKSKPEYSLEATYNVLIHDRPLTKTLNNFRASLTNPPMPRRLSDRAVLSAVIIIIVIYKYF